MNYKKAFEVESDRPTAFEHVKTACKFIGGLVVGCAFAYVYIVLMACM